MPTPKLLGGVVVVEVLVEPADGVQNAVRTAGRCARDAVVVIWIHQDPGHSGKPIHSSVRTTVGTRAISSCKSLATNAAQHHALGWHVPGLEVVIKVEALDSIHRTHTRRVANLTGETAQAADSYLKHRDSLVLCTENEQRRRHDLPEPRNSEQLASPRRHSRGHHSRQLTLSTCAMGEAAYIFVNSSIFVNEVFQVPASTWHLSQNRGRHKSRSYG